MHEPSFNYIQTKFMQSYMRRGKKTLASNLFTQVLRKILKKKRFFAFTSIVLRATANCFSAVQIHEQKRGKQVYLVPSLVKKNRRLFLVVQRFTKVLQRFEYNMFVEQYANELLKAAKMEGVVAKQVQAMNKSIIDNRSFSHFRWF